MKPASILITDDESNIRLMLSTALASDGYTVSEAANGREALDAMQKTMPDLVVLDLNMPVLDGIAVLEQMKTLATIARPRVVILTAYGSIATAVKATRLGASDFLEKPVLPSDLRESVAAALKEPMAHNDRSLDGYEHGDLSVLDRVRRSLRMANYASAETMLMHAAELTGKDPAYYNLLGVLYETRKQLRLARKFYAKADSLSKDYKPAIQNLRRIHEIYRFGKSSAPIALGDEMDIWYAKLTDESH